MEEIRKIQENERAAFVWPAAPDAASRELLAKWFPCKFIFNTVDFERRYS